MIRVFILATIRKPELAPYTELVFKLCCTGFPTAQVEVQLNGAELKYEKVKDAAECAGCAVRVIEETTHHEWIEKLIRTENTPFWILDADVILYGNVEDWKFDGPMAGALIPEFSCEFLKAVTRSRLHTSLDVDRSSGGESRSGGTTIQRHPETIYNPPANLIYPLYLPFHDQTFFYDTMSMMYHAIGGQAFTAQQKDTIFHFHFGTFSDLVLPKIGKEFEAEASRHPREARIGHRRVA